MKRPVAKPLDSTLRFFTPELYVQFNSSDPELADRANDAWEAAVDAYQTHLRRLQKQLPRGAKELSKVSLHDAELLDAQKPIEASKELGLITLVDRSANDEGQARLLLYALAGPVRSTKVRSWPFPAQNPHWLYDEFDQSSTGDGWVHRILLSDGRVVTVPFRDVALRSISSHNFLHQEPALSA